MKMPTEEQIRRAANYYPQAREVLKELFPDAFEEKNPLVGPLAINADRCGGGDHISRHIPPPNIWSILIENKVILHTEKNHPDKIFLSDKYCWKLSEMANGRQFIEIKK